MNTKTRISVLMSLTFTLVFSALAYAQQDPKSLETSTLTHQELSAQAQTSKASANKEAPLKVLPVSDNTQAALITMPAGVCPVISDFMYTLCTENPEDLACKSG